MYYGDLMITNLIYYLYNIKVDYIRKAKYGYIFSYNNSFYIFKEYFGDKSNLLYIVNLCNKFNLLFHEVVLGNNKELVTKYQGKMYILMKIKFNINRKLIINDLVNNHYIVSYVSKKDFFWHRLWSNKIDQVEVYLYDNIDKFNIYTIFIINYFLSLAEQALNVYNSSNSNLIGLSFCHNRVEYDFDLYEYYSVDNLIIDHYTRDIGEYIKSYIYNKDSKDIVSHINNISDNDKDLLLARVLFPSYFFDIFDRYILEDKSFDDFEVNFNELSELNKNINEIVRKTQKKRF